jgi:hypothetical protein
MNKTTENAIALLTNPETETYTCSICGYKETGVLEGILERWTPEVTIITVGEKCRNIECVCPTCSLATTFDEEHDDCPSIHNELYERLKGSYNPEEQLNYNQREIITVVEQQYKDGKETVYQASMQVRSGNGEASSKWLSVSNSVLVKLIELFEEEE